MINWHIFFFYTCDYFVIGSLLCLSVLYFSNVHVFEIESRGLSLYIFISKMSDIFLDDWFEIYAHLMGFSI